MSGSENEDDDVELYQTRHSKRFPHVFPITVTHSEFPSSSAVHERSAMPYGMLLTPFITRSDVTSRTCKLVEAASQVQRCDHCKGYLNPFCDFSSMQWVCSLCSGRNYFPRSAGRYRQADYRTLEETQCILVDYPLHFRSLDGCPELLDGKLSAPCTDRPLIHIFLIQESAPLESLQAIVESISSAIEVMHPDIQIVILTYSHRLCVHRLRLSNSSSSNRVIAIPFVRTSSSNIEPSNHRSHQSHNGIQSDVDVGLQTQLAATVDLFEAASPVGTSHELALAHLAYIQNSYAEEYEHENERRMQADDEEGGGLRHYHDHIHSPPENMLGPALEAVHAWITAPRNFNRSLAEGDGGSDREAQGGDQDDNEGGSSDGFAAHVFDVLASVTQGFMKDIFGTARGGKQHNQSRQNADRKGSQDADTGKSAAEYCSGIFLHVFVSGPQDLPAGAHDSVASLSDSEFTVGGKKAFDAARPGISRSWIEGLGAKFLAQSVCVNLYSVCNLPTEGIGLYSLSPLAQYTGGSISKFTLDRRPFDEVARLREQLRRVAAGSPLATRCVMRFRASPIIDIPSATITGHLREDDELPGIFRMAACHDTSTIGAQIAYRSSDTSLNPSERNNKIVIQMAFSYDTLIEGPERVEEDAKEDFTVIDQVNYWAYAASLLGLEAEKKELNDYESARDADQSRRRSRKKNRTIEERAQSRHGATGGDKFGCAYDRSSVLVSVRRLRIFTVTIQCTHRIPRLIQCSSCVTISVLLARLASLEMLKQSLDGVSGHKVSRASEMILAWAASLLAAHAVSLKAVNPSFTSAFEDSLSHKSSQRLLSMLFGAVYSMNLQSLVNTDSGVALAGSSKRASISNKGHLPRLSIPETDRWTVKNSLLQTCDSYNAHKVLHPLCNPLTAELCIVSDSLPLTREAMVMSSAPAFLVDSGTELILYRTMPQCPAKVAAKPSPPNDSDPSTAPVVSQTATASAPLPSSLSLHQEKPPVSVGSFVGIRALNIPQLLQQGQGLGATRDAEDQHRDQEQLNEKKAEDDRVGEKDIRHCEAAESSNSFEYLCTDPDWLPCVIERRLQVGAIVPTIYLAEAGKASSGILSDVLIGDAVTNGGMSASTFLEEVKVRAKKLVKDQ